MGNGLGVKAMIIPPNGTRSRFYMIQLNLSATATLGTEESAVVKRWPLYRSFKQESIYGFFVHPDVKKVAGVVERWPLAEVRLYIQR